MQRWEILTKPWNALEQLWVVATDKSQRWAEQLIFEINFRELKLLKWKAMRKEVLTAKEIELLDKYCKDEKAKM